MKFNDITKFVHMTGLKLKMHSPQIFLAIGIASGIGAVVMGCKESPKANDILEEHKRNIAKIAQAKALSPSEYSNEDAKKDNFIITTQTAVKLVKAYAPAIALEALSITSILASYHILNGFYVGAVASYKILDDEFRRYRKNNIALNGEESDEKCRYGDLTKTIVEETVDENGVPYTKVSPDPDAVKAYDYSIHWRPGDPMWQDDPVIRRKIIENIQRCLNNHLEAFGYLLMSEAKKEFGKPCNSEDFVTGWLEKRFGGQDSCVILTIKEVSDNDWIIDFNVDGLILGKLGEVERSMS